MSEQTAKPAIIIVKKKHAGDHGHHGGAWKVAYADFVTAMMALFIVLWLMNSSQELQEAIGGYFRDPTGAGKQKGSAHAGSGDGITIASQDMGKLKDELSRAMKQMPEFQRMKEQVEMTVTGEGLRVELLETERGMFFDSGNSSPSKTGEELLAVMAKELGKLSNNLLIEVHTDAKPYAGVINYTNWELSTDRANSARRLMETSGLRLNQVVQVRGFADRHLRASSDPTNASNRRISVIVQYQDAPVGSGKPAAGSGKAKKPQKGH